MRFVMFFVVLSSLVAAAQETELPPAVGDNPAEVSPPLVASPETPQNTITIGPFSLITGTIDVEFERAVSPKLSLFAGPNARIGAGLLSLIGFAGFGFGAHGGVRYFLTTNPAPEGLWVGPELAVDYLKYTSFAGQSVDWSIVSAGGVAMIGYTVILDNNFVMSFGAGGGIGWTSNSLSAGGQTAATAGIAFKPALRIALGYAF